MVGRLKGHNFLNPAAVVLALALSINKRMFQSINMNLGVDCVVQALVHPLGVY